MPRSSGRIDVLHVDDEPDFTALAADILERQDERFDVQTAQSGSEGLLMLREHDFDCVVSDFDMPGETGIEFLEAVRESYPDLPFILYTGKGSEEVASDAISAGVTDYLQKESGTSQYEVLANRITNAVEQHRAREEAVQTEQRLQIIAENTNDILWKFTADWDELLFINSPYEEIWGRSVDGLKEQPRSFLKGVHPDDLPTVEEAMERLSAGDSVDFEFRVNAEEDYGRWVWVQGEPIIADSGEVEKVVGFARDITERKTKEQELEVARSDYEALFEASPVPIWVQGLRKIYYANTAAAEFHGVSDPEELIGRSAFEFVPENEHEVTLHRNKRMLNEGESLNATQGTMVTEDGEKRQAIFSAAPITYRGKQALVAFALDISERRKREEALQQERNRVEALFANSVDAIAYTEFVDGEPIVRDVNQAFEETFGYDRETAIGRPIDELVLPEDSAKQEEASELNRRIETGERIVTEVRRRTPDGVRDFLLQSTPLDPGESGAKSYAIYSDMTDRIEREEALRETTRRLDIALKATDTGVWEWNLDTDEVVWTEPLERLLGLEPGTFGGTSDAYQEYLHPDDAANVERAVEQAIEGDGIFTAEFRMIRTDGEEIWVQGRGEYIDKEGSKRMIGTITDITERKEREQDLEEAHELTEALSTTFPDYTFIYNAEGEYLDVITGWEGGPNLHTPEELIGQTVQDLLADDTAERIQKAIQSTLETGELQTIEYTVQTPGGTYWYEANLAPLEAGYGGESAVVLTARDVTERKERERELQRQNERLEEFASVVSHDLRNPLSVADGRLQLAIEEREWGELDAVSQALDRMETLIDDMLSLSNAGKAVGAPEAVELAELTEACWRNVETESATFRCEAATTIQADKTRLQQLLENLLRNAVDHVGDDVTVTIGELADGFYVEDDGSGIPPEERAKILEPGYSTRTDGTGFGLSIVRDIAEAHGWEMKVTEGADGGARFEFRGVET